MEYNILDENLKLSYGEINKLILIMQELPQDLWKDEIRKYFLEHKVGDMHGFEIIDEVLEEAIDIVYNKIEEKIC